MQKKDKTPKDAILGEPLGQSPLSSLKANGASQVVFSKGHLITKGQQMIQKVNSHLSLSHCENGPKLNPFCHFQKG